MNETKILIAHFEKNGCLFLSEGSKHNVYTNPKTNRVSTVPRHNEINDFLAKKICKDLDIPVKQK
ncbi:MAG: type II toxin-antitoxin system HicA family toxin [Ignavibacteria bacterium]|nr:type II toxin-antitoxin system HicA family toxin [Ignavibacteria bacterium]